VGLRRYSRELLLPIVEKSRSVAQVISALGLKQAGGNHRHLVNVLKRLDISTVHFDGQVWNKGKTEYTDVRVARAIRQRYKDEEVFCRNSQLTEGNKIKKRLLRLGWIYQCAICGISEWMGKFLALHLDHINGVNDDNRYENLRFLCPNCHQQTETWGSRNRRDVVERQTQQVEGLPGFIARESSNLSVPTKRIDMNTLVASKDLLDQIREFDNHLSNGVPVEINANSIVIYAKAMRASALNMVRATVGRDVEIAEFLDQFDVYELKRKSA
jgi:5-methylcytosine-specific restriction endonuclease McrA